MDSRAKTKSEMSLCEKWMEVIANVITLFSFSIAPKTLRAAGKPAKDLSGSDYTDMVPEKELLVPDQFSKSKRSKEPQSRANPTYVTKAVVSNGSTSHVIQEERVEAKKKKEDNIDGLASDYIRKIRKQLGCGL